MLIKCWSPNGSSSTHVNTSTSSSIPPKKGSDQSYKGDELKMNKVRVLQMKLQLDTLVVMKDIHQNIQFKERDAILPGFRESLTEICTRGLPTV